MGNEGLRGDSAAHYESIAVRQRDNFETLMALSRKSAWAKYYLPRSPRDITVFLMNGFRIEAWRTLGRAGREEAVGIAAAVVNNQNDERAARAIDSDVREARRRLGLLDPPRRTSNPDPELSDSEHQRIEMLLTAWLHDALSEFGPDQVP